jgi:hypothetical protein
MSHARFGKKTFTMVALAPKIMNAPFMWSIGDMLPTSHLFVSYNFLFSKVLSNSILSSVIFHKKKWWIRNCIDIFGLGC